MSEFRCQLTVNTLLRGESSHVCSRSVVWDADEWRCSLVFVWQHGLGAVVSATKASAALPAAWDEFDLYRSFPAFQQFCASQGDQLSHWWTQALHPHTLIYTILLANSWDINKNIYWDIKKKNRSICHFIHGFMEDIQKIKEWSKNNVQGFCWLIFLVLICPSTN